MPVIKKARREKGTRLKIAIILPAILILAILSCSLHSLSDPLSMRSLPEVPRGGEPILVMFTIRNFEPIDVPYTYELYANGAKVLEGKTRLSPLSAKQYQHSYLNPLKLGEQTNFMVKVTTPYSTYQEVLRVPLYHPYLWTSFVSFASFSSSIAGFSSSMGISSMTSLTSMAYYQGSFGVRNAINVGVIFSIVLIALLIHVEVTEPYGRMLNMLGRLRRRFNKLSAVLFIIFMSMVFTQIALILSWVG
jgi:hypothetical protein